MQTTLRLHDNTVITLLRGQRRERFPGYSVADPARSLTTAISDDQIPAFLQVDGEQVGERAGEVAQAISGFPESLHRRRS